MTKLRATNETDRIDSSETSLAITESDKAIFDFVHVDGEEHTVIMSREEAEGFADMIEGQFEKHDQ